MTGEGYLSADNEDRADGFPPFTRAIDRARSLWQLATLL
jgi:hypothetical protein